MQKQKKINSNSNSNTGRSSILLGFIIIITVHRASYHVSLHDYAGGNDNLTIMNKLYHFIISIIIYIHVHTLVLLISFARNC